MKPLSNDSIARQFIRQQRRTDGSPRVIDITADYEAYKALQSPTFMLDEQNRTVIEGLPYLIFPTLNAAQKFARRVAHRGTKGAL